MYIEQEGIVIKRMKQEKKKQEITKDIKQEIEQIAHDMEHEKYELRYQYVVGILEAKINIINEQLSREYHREIIRDVNSRLKKPDSIHAKLVRKGYETNFATAKKKLNDLIGIRIICLFQDDIYRVAEMLEKQQDLEIVKIKDYIESPKKNGYMSLHLIVDLPIYLGDKKETKRAEIQIRTTAMDFWSVLDYQMIYKKDVKGAEEAAKELKGYSEEIAALDRKMVKLREKIARI